MQKPLTSFGNSSAYFMTLSNAFDNLHIEIQLRAPTTKKNKIQMDASKTAQLRNQYYVI